MINQLLGLVLMAPQGGGQDGGQSMTSFLIMMGSIVLIFYFLIFRPQKKRQKQREEELSKIDKGDKVIYSVPSWNNNHYVHYRGKHRAF